MLPELAGLLHLSLRPSKILTVARYDEMWKMPKPCMTDEWILEMMIKIGYSVEYGRRNLDYRNSCSQNASTSNIGNWWWRTLWFTVVLSQLWNLLIGNYDCLSTPSITSSISTKRYSWNQTTWSWCRYDVDRNGKCNSDSIAIQWFIPIDRLGLEWNGLSAFWCFVKKHDWWLCSNICDIVTNHALEMSSNQFRQRQIDLPSVPSLSLISLNIKPPFRLSIMFLNELLQWLIVRLFLLNSDDANLVAQFFEGLW